MYFLGTYGQTENGGVHMDKKIFNKSSNFFKREGFYVILFVCLCVVAAVAAVTAKNSIKLKNTPISQNNLTEQKNGSSTTNVAQEPSVEYENALQVKKNNRANISVPKNGSTGVVAATDTSFVKPVNGTIARQFSSEPVYWDSTNSYRPNFGIDIKTDLGEPVVAVLNGKVEKVSSTTENGVEIVIDHQNGLKTVYSNLDAKVLVTQGQTVKKGEKIGVVGNTTLNAAYEKYGDHLHFEVLKSKQSVDPLKYIKY